MQIILLTSSNIWTDIGKRLLNPCLYFWHSICLVNCIIKLYYYYYYSLLFIILRNVTQVFARSCSPSIHGKLNSRWVLIMWYLSAVLTETWLTGTEFDKTIISIICPLGFTCVHVPRKDRRGWDIAIILKKGYKTNIQTGNTYNTFDHMIVSIVSTNLCTITL